MKKFSDFRVKKINEAEPAQQAAHQPQQPQQTQTQASQPQSQPQPQPEQTQQTQQSPRESLAGKIKPQYEVAKAVVDGIHQAFQNDCGKVTKWDPFAKQIKDFEGQIRNACKSVIATVQTEKFDWHNWDNCSPASFSSILQYKDRDFDAIKLSAAVIIFYNSLLGVN